MSCRERLDYSTAGSDTVGSEQFGVDESTLESTSSEDDNEGLWPSDGDDYNVPRGLYRGVPRKRTSSWMFDLPGTSPDGCGTLSPLEYTRRTKSRRCHSRWNDVNEGERESNIQQQTNWTFPWETSSLSQNLLDSSWGILDLQVQLYRYMKTYFQLCLVSN